MFEIYCDLRAKELVQENKYLFEHESFKKHVYFYEDLKETMTKVHRQSNEHKRNDFADSELIVQDFIRRNSDPDSPERRMFAEDGSIKVYN